MVLKMSFFLHFILDLFLAMTIDWWPTVAQQFLIVFSSSWLPVHWTRPLYSLLIVSTFHFITGDSKLVPWSLPFFTSVFSNSKFMADFVTLQSLIHWNADNFVEFLSEFWQGNSNEISLDRFL